MRRHLIKQQIWIRPASFFSVLSGHGDAEQRSAYLAGPRRCHHCLICLCGGNFRVKMRFFFFFFVLLEEKEKVNHSELVKMPEVIPRLQGKREFNEIKGHIFRLLLFIRDSSEAPSVGSVIRKLCRVPECSIFSHVFAPFS